MADSQVGFSATVVFTTVATVITIVGAYLYHKKKDNIPETWEEVGPLEKINIYPLKSGHRLELDTADCTKLGISQIKNGKGYELRDRCLIVYMEKNKEFITARTYPKMVLISVSVANENHIAVDAPNMNTLYVKIPSKSEIEESIITLHCNEKTYTIDCGDEAASWFSKYILGKYFGLRLGYHDGSHKRDIKNVFKPLMDYYKKLSNDSAGLYHDLTSILIINQASIDDLRKKMDNSTITVENFRSNLIVNGPDIQAFDEDSWDWLKIGDAVFRNVKDCTRCILTTVNPDTGIRGTDMEPLKTLKRYRISSGLEKLPVMGLHLEVKKPGNIKVGDPVYVSKNSN